MRPTQRVDQTTSWVVLFGGAGRQQVISTLLDAGTRIAAVIVPREAPSKLERACEEIRKMGVNLFPAGRDDLADVLFPYANKPLLSLGFPYLLPPEILKRHQVALNVHPTLLPMYRGRTSGAFVLLNGDAMSGSTVHAIEASADTGPILHQVKVKLTPFDTVRSMQRKVYAAEPGLVLEAMQLLRQGWEPVVEPTSGEAQCPIRSPEDSEIDPDLSIRELWNSIRACDADDFPAFFTMFGEKVCIKLWRPHKSADAWDEI